MTICLKIYIITLIITKISSFVVTSVKLMPLSVSYIKIDQNIKKDSASKKEVEANLIYCPPLLNINPIKNRKNLYVDLLQFQTSNLVVLLV